MPTQVPIQRDIENIFVYDKENKLVRITNIEKDDSKSNMDNQRLNSNQSSDESQEDQTKQYELDYNTNNRSKNINIAYDAQPFDIYFP